MGSRRARRPPDRRRRRRPRRDHRPRGRSRRLSGPAGNPPRVRSIEMESRRHDAEGSVRPRRVRRKRGAHELGRRAFLAGSAAHRTCAARACAQTPDPTVPTVGGRGGRIIRVTTLTARRPRLDHRRRSRQRARASSCSKSAASSISTASAAHRRAAISPSPGRPRRRRASPSSAAASRSSRARSNVVIQHIAVRPGEAGAGEEIRLGVRRHLRLRRVSTSSSRTARSPGRPTKVSRPPASASARTTRLRHWKNGARSPRTTSSSATTSSPRAFPTRRTPRASIPRAR